MKRFLATAGAAGAALAVAMPTTIAGAMPIEDAIYIALRTHPSILATQHDGWGTSQRTKAAEARLQGAEFSVFGASEAVALRAASGYVNVVRGMTLLELADRYVAAHGDVVAALETQVEAGAGTQADLDQAIGRMALAEAARTQFAGALLEPGTGKSSAIGRRICLNPWSSHRTCPWMPKP